MSATGRLVKAEMKLMVRDPLVLTFVFAFPVVTMLIIGGAFGTTPTSAFDHTNPAHWYVASYLTEDPSLARPVVKGEPDLCVEFVYQRRHEMALFAEFAIGASVMAWRDAGFPDPPGDAGKDVGCIIGVGLGGVESIERNNVWLWQQARETNAVDYLRAVRRLNTVTRQFAAFFVDHDIWLTPTMAAPPPALGHLHADVEDVPEFFRRLWTFNPLNTIYNGSGQPAISLPLAWSKSNLPIGVQFVGRFGEEHLLLQLAAQIEQAEPWSKKRPPVYG